MAKMVFEIEMNENPLISNIFTLSHDEVQSVEDYTVMIYGVMILIRKDRSLNSCNTKHYIL